MKEQSTTQLSQELSSAALEATVRRLIVQYTDDQDLFDQLNLRSAILKLDDETEFTTIDQDTIDNHEGKEVSIRIDNTSSSINVYLSNEQDKEFHIYNIE